MANNIKGITVEIGGNTGPLDNALKGVNKTSRDLQSELREVNRQLKLDPGNTTLLAQKQRLLAESITNTRGKLETLKEAERQVELQFQRGEIGEERYRALQREVIRTEQQLQQLEQQVTHSSAALNRISVTAGNVADSAGKVAGKMAPATAAIIGVGTAAFNMGSDFIESTNKVEVAFQDNAKSVEDFSKTTLDNFGIASGSALDMAALFGDMGTAMGQSTDEAATMSTSLVGLAGDLASFKNIGIEQAQDALKGIFTGEGEALKSLGVIMQDSTLKEYALSQGITKKYEEMTQSEKVQLRYNYVMAMTKNAQGDFARTSDGAANSMRVASESAKEAASSVGVMLAPIIAKVAQYVASLTKNFTGLDDGTKRIILVILGLIAAIAPVAGLISGIATIVGAATVVIGTISGAIGLLTGTLTVATPAATALAGAITFITGPIGLTILAITALVAGFILLWNNCESFRNFWINLWNKIKAAAKVTVDALVHFFTQTIPNAWKSVVNFFKGIPTWFSNLWKSVKNTTQNLWNNILNTFRTIISTIINFVTSKFGWLFSGLKKIFDGLKLYFDGIWKVIKNLFLGAILLIINLCTGNFTKLKSDSVKIFNNLKAAFSQIWKGIKLIFSGVIGIIVNYVKAAWTGLVNIGKAIWNGFKNFLSSMWQGIKNTAVSAWNGLKNAIVNLCTSIKNGAINIFNNMKNGVVNTVTGVKNAIVNGINGAIKWIKAIPRQAVTWGKDMIQGMINGIRNMIGKVEDAVVAVANKIRSFLHFTVPDEGPLTDYETWMPDFMEGLSHGIKNSKSLVIDAIKGLSTDMSVGMQLNPALAGVGSISNKGAAKQGNTNNHSYGSLLSTDQVVINNGMDIQTLAQELEFYRKQYAKSKGVD